MKPFLGLLLITFCCHSALALSVYEPFHELKNLLNDGEETVEFSIRYFSDNDKASKDTFTQDSHKNEIGFHSTDLVEDVHIKTFVDDEEISGSRVDKKSVVDFQADVPKVWSTIPDPPEHKETAKMSRYLCHYSDWLAMATISTRGALTGTPFASVFSFSDGPVGKSSGIPYFYLTDLDMSTHDLHNNPKASVTISLAQSGYCKVHNLDAEDPRCAHVILAGEVIKVPQNSSEEAFAKEALFSRHPVMPDWPTSHGWYFAKLNITNVILLDFFGGAIDVPLEEYYKAVL